MPKLDLKNALKIKNSAGEFLALKGPAGITWKRYEVSRVPVLVSSSSVFASSIDIPEHQVGDLIIISGYRTNNNTLITRPSGWDGPAGSAGGSNSIIWGWKVAAGNSETSGTWTSASVLIARVYRKHGGVGSSALGSGSGTSITIPGITLAGDSGTSLIDRFVGAKTGWGLSLPSGHTKHVQADTGGERIAEFYTAPGTYYASASLTADATSPWRSATIEILPAPLEPSIWQTTITTSSYDAGSGNFLTGYNSGAGLPAFGTKDKEPILGETFLAFWHNAANNQLAIAFAGNITSILAGKQVHIAGGSSSSSWTYYSSGTPFGIPVTMMLLSGQAAIPYPQDFLIEIK